MRSGELYSTPAMVAFEPSTWAEVEEAEAMGKAVLRGGSNLARDIVRFSVAPERSLAPCEPAQPTPPPRPQSPEPVRDEAAVKARACREDIPAQRLIRAKRADMHFDDLLRAGRVNLATRTLVRSGGARAVHERSLFSDATRPLATHDSPLNPSSTQWRAADYVRILHTRTTRTGLEAGLKNVQAMLTAIETQADTLRTRAFPSVCLAAAELEATRKGITLRQAPYEFRQAEKALSRTYAGVAQKQEAVGRLASVLRVLSRFGWVFETGQAMRNAAASVAPLEVLERLARDYVRAREWANAQTPGIASRRVAADLDDAVVRFGNAITVRLGDSRTPRGAMRRYVSVLGTVGEDRCIADALVVRMQTAREKLAAAVASTGSVQTSSAPDSEATVSVKAATGAFLGGLSSYWRLACVVSLYESCATHAHTHVPSFIAYYVAAIETVGLLPRDAAVEVLRAHNVASNTLKLPRDYIMTLRRLADSVTRNFIHTTEMAVQRAARDAAVAVIDGRVDARAAAALVRAVVTEATAQMDDVLRRRRTFAVTSTSTRSTATTTDDAEKNVASFRKTCSGALAEAAKVLAAQVEHADDGGALALRAAVFCCEAGQTELGANAVRAYVRAAAPAMEARARRVVQAYRHGQAAMSHQGRGAGGGGPVVSAAASELVLELALAASAVRRRGAGPEVALAVSKELVARVGSALCSAAAAVKLQPGHARRVRTDCEFLAAALSSYGESAEGFEAAANIAGDMCADDTLTVRRGGVQRNVAAAIRHVSLLRMCLEGGQQTLPM